VEVSADENAVVPDVVWAELAAVVGTASAVEAIVVV
jgi:hypothetical protein